MKKTTAKVITRIIAVCGFITSLFIFLMGLFLTFGSTLFFSLFPFFAATIGSAPIAWLANWLLLVIGLFFVLLGIFRFIVAYGLWEFRSWARIIEIIFAVICLFWFPLGTVLGAIKIYFLGFDKDIRRLFR
jgi:hypothetical protein